MSKADSVATRARPGRPRSERARRAILESAYAILQEKGFGQVTVEAVAARAGVGKPTIYRYWANAGELAMAAVLARPDEGEAPVSGTDPLAQWRVQLRHVAERFATPTGRQVTRMMAASDRDSELAKSFRNQIILKSREEGRALLLGAIEAGLVRRDVPVEPVLDLVYGPFFYRLLTGHAGLDPAFADAVLDTLLAGIAGQPGASG